MIERSDRSGPVQAAGFRTYLSGYSLPSDGVYVLARTWEAPEAERPGTVWTHSLLLPLDAIGSIPEMADLNRLFRHPTSATNVASYSTPLAIERVDGLLRSSSVEISGGVFEMLARPLYGRPTEPLLLEAESSDASEAALLRLWSQQWPRLRASFQFCTGVLSRRGRGLQGFDVQIGPPGWTQLPLGRIAEVPGGGADWVKLLVDDLMAAGSELGAFLKRYGDESDRGRSDVVPLVTVYQRIAGLGGDLTSAAMLVDALVAEDVGRRLPTMQDDVLAANSDPVVENALLSAILRSGIALSTVLEGSLSRRVAALTRQNPSFGLSLLAACMEGSSPRLALVSSSVALGIEEQTQPMSPLDSAMAMTLVAARPQLASRPGVLTRDPLRQRQILDVLAHAQGVPIATTRAFVAELIRLDSALPVQALRVLGGSAVAEVMDLLSATEGVQVSRAWTDEVGRYPNAVRDWLSSATSIGFRAAEVVAEALAPTEAVVASRQATWAALAERIRSDDPDRVVGFLFLAASGFAPTFGPHTTVLTFAVLHDRAKMGRLSAECWDLLAPRLPRLVFWREWDMCEKLRRAVAERFLSNGWSPTALADAPGDDEVVTAILDRMGDGEGGRAVVREAARELVARRPSLRSFLVRRGFVGSA